MTRSWSFAAVAVGAALLASALLSSPVAAQATNCQWYATTALKQQQENEKLKCGFTGDAWSSDFKAHTAWCGSVAPDAWKRAAQERDQQLQACAKKK